VGRYCTNDSEEYTLCSGLFYDSARDPEYVELNDRMNAEKNLKRFGAKLLQPLKAICRH
jgi:hypothetical protein